METKKSKVTGIIFDKSGQGKNGPWHSFTIGFENGDSGKYFANANPQTYFKMNEVAEYTKEVTQNGQYTNTKISPVRQGNGGGKFFGGSPTAQNKRTALECSVQLVVAGKITSEQALGTAKKFSDWLNADDQPKPQAPPAPQPPAPSDDFRSNPSDDLPF